MSDTPRTDEVLAPYTKKGMVLVHGYFVESLIEHARKLERELNEAHKASEVYKNTATFWQNYGSNDTTNN
jgi:hypothetical protein